MSKPLLDIIKKATISGILIGLGVIINSILGAPLGPVLFSFGLLTIIQMKQYLYTGKIGFISKTKEIPFLIVVLIFNFIGITATVGLYALANNSFIEIITNAAFAKFSKSFSTLFINAIFCGMLIHFAVKMKQSLLTVFAIMIFIMIGAEHCIADFPYFMFNFSWINLLKLLTVVAGNSVGAIVIERLSKEHE